MKKSKPSKRQILKATLSGAVDVQVSFSGKLLVREARSEEEGGPHERWTVARTDDGRAVSVYQDRDRLEIRTQPRDRSLERLEDDMGFPKDVKLQLREARRHAVADGMLRLGALATLLEGPVLARMYYDGSYALCTQTMFIDRDQGPVA
jgi:hypothetical protein